MARPDIPKLSNEEKSRFESCLKDAESIEALRKFALDLSAKGIKQQGIYLIFLAFYVQLRSAGREDEEAVLGDVMDMIVDAYSPFNLNLPK